MRRGMIGIAIMLAAFAGTATAARASGSRASSNPTRAQIRRAVAHAERSSYLWATVNICRRVGKGGLVGIRGEMTALGFRSTLSMTVQLRRYDRSHRRYVVMKGKTATRTESLGSLRTGVHQDGAEFHFASDPGRLDATVTFSWTRDGRRLGRVTRTTAGGHPRAAFSEPKRHSAASCRL